MSTLEKQPFQNQAETDKERFNNEMRTYLPEGAAHKAKKVVKIKPSRDPNAPKRPLSAFFWFCNDERPKFREKNPGYSAVAVSKELGRMWGEVDPKTKERYIQMSEKDKERYLEVSLTIILSTHNLSLSKSFK